MLVSGKTGGSRNFQLLHSQRVHQPFVSLPMMGSGQDAKQISLADAPHGSEMFTTQSVSVSTFQFLWRKIMDMSQI